MTGDLQDFIKRINSVLPPWFGETYPLLSSFITGYATLDVFIYQILQYVKNQMRIQTSTDDNLDLEACDYFGDFVKRRFGMDDTAFRKLILATLLEEMATKQGMINAITAVTGIPPVIIEPWDPTGNIGYENLTWGYETNGAYGGGGLEDAYTFYITVYVAGNPMETKYGGYEQITWGYDAANPPSNGAYGDPEINIYTWTYDDILAIINRVKVGGTKAVLTLIYV